MMKFILAIIVAVSVLIPNTTHAQPVQIDERFGIGIQFPDGFQKLSEDLYSPGFHRQLFSTENEELTVYVARFSMLGAMEKQQWAKGMPGYPLSSADEVIEMAEEDWPFAKPVFNNGLLEDSTAGMSVFLTHWSYPDVPNLAAYIIFLARDNAYILINAGMKTKDRESDLAQLDELLATVVFGDTIPPVGEDIYSQAEQAYLVEKNLAKASKLYDLVPAKHPMYAEAQRRLGYQIKGSTLGDWEGAAGHMEEAFRLEPDDNEIIRDLGRVYLKTDRYESGVALLENAGEDEQILRTGSVGPEMMIGTFEDDYAVPYTIKNGVIYQHTSNTYHIKYWNPEEQYLIAQNDRDNDGGQGLWTRIDWIALADMAPYTWAYCLSAYDAKTAKEAEEVQVANRNEPRTGCNGFPFSRMKPAP